MRHRIFIAINLPEEIKQKLVSYQEKVEELFTPYRSEASGSGPIRWTKKDSLHITLEFLGYLSDEEVLKVCQDTKELALKHQPFSITLNKICYGPPKKMPSQSMNSSNSFPRSSHSGTPRMIWVVGEKIEELNFSPHITLGRIRTWEFRKIEPEERPEVNEEINLNFEVNSIEVMESVLKRTGPDYIILESCPLKLN